MLFGDVKPLMVSLMALGEQLVEFSAVMMLVATADDDHSLTDGSEWKKVLNDWSFVCGERGIAWDDCEDRGKDGREALIRSYQGRRWWVSPILRGETMGLSHPIWGGLRSHHGRRQGVVGVPSWEGRRVSPIQSGEGRVESNEQAQTRAILHHLLIRPPLISLPSNPRPACSDPLKYSVRCTVMQCMYCAVVNTNYSFYCVCAIVHVMCCTL